MKSLKILFLLVGILTVNISTMISQTSPSADNFSAGVHVGQFKNDVFGGINITSPYFADKMLAIRVNANGKMFEYIPLEKTEYTRSSYYNLQLGLVIRNKTGIANVLYPYIEFGGMGIIPNKDFTEKDLLMGLYMIGGLEGLSKTGRMGYFVDFGFEATNKDKAEKAIGSPYYTLGARIAIGWRMYIGK
jgi:hypothetical protein